MRVGGGEGREGEPSEKMSAIADHHDLNRGRRRRERGRRERMRTRRKK